MANQTTIKFDQIIGDIAKRQFSPIYFLEGEETYFIDALADKLEEQVLKPEEKSFNLIITYGKDTSALDIKMSARRYPMMSEYQLIMVREAQLLDDLDPLEDYFENPMKSTILVFSFKGKKIDKRKKIGKLLSKYTHFTSERLRDYETIPWVEKLIKSKGKSIEPKALELIVEFLGSDLAKITSEIDKMLINVKNDVSLINIHHVEQNIGVSKDYNIFEFQKALGQKNFNKTIQIANYFAANSKNHSIFPILTNLYGYFSKVYAYHTMKHKSKKEIAIGIGVNEFFVEDYRVASLNFSPAMIEQVFGYLKYYDLRAKGVNDTGTEEGQLLIELTVKMLKIAEIPSSLKLL